MKGAVRALLGLLAAVAFTAGPGLCQQEIVSQVSVVHYDVTLKPDFENNAMDTGVTCTIRNDGLMPLLEMDFNILMREGRCGAWVSVTSVSRDVEGEKVSQEFSTVGFEEAEGAGMGPTKLVRVRLSPPLESREATGLHFEYRWEVLEPRSREIHYQLFPTLDNGDREIFLIQDFAWLPRPLTMSFANWRWIGETSWLPKFPMPSWTLTISTPPEYEAVALGGRLTGSDEREEKKVSRWESTALGEPQVMVARFNRVEVEGRDIRVVFFIPRDVPYEQGAVEAMADILSRAHSFYSELFGPLDGEEIHVGVSSANPGGHGGYLGMTLGVDEVRKQLQEFRQGGFWYLGAHELSHSWWGWSVSSYGRGSKFLRESFSEFGCRSLQDGVYGGRWFQERLAFDFNYNRALLRRTHDRESAAFSQGPLFLNNVLKPEMGDQAFSEMLRALASRYRDDYVTVADFIEVCNEVSGRDLTAFLKEWLFQDASSPDYQLVSFQSERGNGGWKTAVTIRNEGELIITCPLELRMEEKTQRERFRVKAGSSDTFNYETPAEVEEVEIDPDHNVYQGGVGRECLLKALAVGDAEFEYEETRYRQGLARSLVLGEHERAIEDISDALDVARERGSQLPFYLNKVPAFLYSRGMVYLRMGDSESARKDLSSFISVLLEEGRGGRSGRARPAALVLPRIKELNRIASILGTHRDRDFFVAGDYEQWALPRAHEILKRITGHDFEHGFHFESEEEFSQTVEGWHKQWWEWWQENEESFELSPAVNTLKPWGPTDDMVEEETPEFVLRRKIDRLDAYSPGGKELKLFEEAKAVGPRIPGLWFKLGFALYIGRNYEGALDAFRHEQEVTQKGIKAFEAVVWQGHMLDLLDRREEAVKAYNEALELDVGRRIGGTIRSTEPGSRKGCRHHTTKPGSTVL